MRVKLNFALWYANMVHKAGSEIDLPDDIAKTLAELGTVEIRHSRRPRADASSNG